MAFFTEGVAMLVIERKAGKRLVIGGEIVVTVLETHRGRVRLGIEAPQDIEVWREELHAGQTRPLHRTPPKGWL
jgi:carbon storage regulator